MEAAEGSERHPPVKEEDGTILTQEKGKGWKENGAITRARTAPEDTEDELAPVAAGLLIPHLDEEDGEALVEESTTPLTEEAPVAKFTQISMMEDAEKDLVVEEAADMWLRCPVCWELLFKPAVIACGHIYCLDCLLQAMNIAGVSSCAVCKMTYDHFPSECASIGVLVLKSVKGDINGKRIVGDKVQLSDITCSVCKEILCEPSVLNCGHVFCISCLNVDGDKIKCPSCDAFHCNDHPVVCTYASHFIKACFPEAYESRVQKMQTSSGTHFLGYKGKSQNVKLSHTHVGVGCDCCGVYPIQGDRFTCKTCDNFDLCQKCVKKNISIQGRFGQQHLSDHVLELDDSFLFGTVLDVLNQKNEEDGGEAELPENDREELQLPEWEPGLLRWGWTDEQAPEDDDGPEGLAGFRRIVDFLSWLPNRLRGWLCDVENTCDGLMVLVVHLPCMGSCL